jgi:hypothetical protein
MVIDLDPLAATVWAGANFGTLGMLDRFGFFFSFSSQTI